VNAYSFSLGDSMEKYFELSRAYYTYLKNSTKKNVIFLIELMMMDKINSFCCILVKKVDLK
jgi:hypothetical protein